MGAELGHDGIEHDGIEHGGIEHGGIGHGPVERAADYWIERLGLVPHPEGGFYRETYRSSEGVEASALPDRYAGPRSFLTAIYFLITGERPSHLHRLRSDELWLYHDGSRLTLHLLHDDGTYRQIHVGRDPGKDEHLQALVPAGCWFGATVDGEDGARGERSDSFALVSCILAPGFEFEDFELGKRDELLRIFPAQRNLIERLTPDI